MYVICILKVPAFNAGQGTAVTIKTFKDFLTVYTKIMEETIVFLLPIHKYIVT